MTRVAFRIVPAADAAKIHCSACGEEATQSGVAVPSDAVTYDNNLHDVEFVAGTRLAEVFEGTPRATVNSVHHQAIKDLHQILG